MAIHGDGRYGVYVEGPHHYATGTKAAWPDIFLYEYEEDAQDQYDRVVTDEAQGLDRHRSRVVYVFEFPDDPRHADEYEDRTLAGIRAKYA